MKQTNLNIPLSVLQKVGKNLHLQPNHPVSIISKLVIGYFESLGRNFVVDTEMDPVVTVKQNFDDLLIPLDHPARSLSDTYYFDENTLLRTHTSAHQTQHLKSGHNAFLAVGDVYRKDEIDRSHYPVFHQIEGVYIFDQEIDIDQIQKDLIDVLIGLCHVLFPGAETRVNDDYFPFTHPSYEIEVLYNEKWLEILGCGIIQPKILENCTSSNPNLLNESGDLKKGWAFGIGLDRLAMILFEIPDIRLLWVEDDKFTSQFREGQISKFISYSILDSLEKDISFWIPDEQIDYDPTCKEYIDGYGWLKEKDMLEIIREVSNDKHSDIVESATCFDQFYHTGKKQLSRAYRIKYSVPDPKMNNGSELNSLCNELHRNIAASIKEALNVTIR